MTEATRYYPLFHLLILLIFKELLVLVEALSLIEPSPLQPASKVLCYFPPIRHDYTFDLGNVMIYAAIPDPRATARS